MLNFLQVKNDLYQGKINGLEIVCRKYRTKRWTSTFYYEDITDEEELLGWVKEETNSEDMIHKKSEEFEYIEDLADDLFEKLSLAISTINYSDNLNSKKETYQLFISYRDFNERNEEVITVKSYPSEEESVMNTPSVSKKNEITEETLKEVLETLNLLESKVSLIDLSTTSITGLADTILSLLKRDEEEEANIDNDEESEVLESEENEFSNDEDEASTEEQEINEEVYD